MKRVVVLISGGGSNMMALVRDMTGDHPARAVLVFSNVPEADGLAKATDMGIATAVTDHRPFGKDRASFEAELQKHLEAAAPDIICHAGFMRILTPGFVDRWQGRMLNIHPSLLPKYPGLHTHAQVLANGDPEHGCSVHLVASVLDGGPVLGQARLSVRPGDTPETLAARVLTLEHKLYPMVLRNFAQGNLAPVQMTDFGPDDPGNV